MKKIADRSRYIAETVTAVRFLAIILPLLVLFVLTLVPLGIIHCDAYQDWAYYVSAAILLSVSLLEWHFLIRSPRIIASILTALHIVGILSVFAITGFHSIILFLWLPLLIASYVFFGNVAFIASSFILGLIGVIGIYNAWNDRLLYVSQVLIEYTFVLLLAYAIIRLIDQLASVHEDLQRSKARELKQHDQLTTLLNSMLEAVITTDENGIIKTQNAAALALLDTNQSIVGQSVDEVFHLKTEDDKKVTLSSVLEKTHAATMNNDLLHYFSKADYLHLSLQIAPIHKSFRAEGDPGFIVILRDITKEKSLEEERDEFISVISHELRTPVAIAEGGLSNLLLMQQKDLPKDIQKEASNAAYQQVLYLASMINDLSTLSRAERGVGADKEVVDLQAVIEGVYHGYKQQALDKKLHLNLDIPKRLPHTITSKLYLEEILQNFMTNALRYTLKGSVTISATYENDKTIKFSITDSGIGISKSDQKKIFEKFYRAEDYRTRQTGGTGLGLYVVQKLARKLGVHIMLESRLNYGSTFSFVLPVLSKDEA